MSRKTKPVDSLELFLDTICNTFGGILFILLFVVLLLKGTEKQYIESQTPKITEEDVAELTDRLDDLNLKIEATSNRHSAVKADLDSSNLQEKNEALKILNNVTAEKETLEKTESEIEEEIKVVREELDRKSESTEEEKSRLLERIDDLKRKIEDTKSKIQITDGSEIRMQSMPQLQETSLDSITLVVCFGRLYKLHEDDKTGKLNTRDFVVVESTEDGYHVMAKPWRGIDLQEMDKAKSDLLKIVSGFPNTKYRVSIAVSSDSFQYFDPVCSVFKERGYKIEPFSFSEVESLTFTDRGGTVSRAQ